MDDSQDPEREHALSEYKKKLIESREWEAKLKALRLEIKSQQRDFDVSEENIKALQSVGQIIGEVLKQLDDERCEFMARRHHSQMLMFASCSKSLSKLPLDPDMLSADGQRSRKPD